MGVLSIAGRTAMRWTVWARVLLLAEVGLAIKRHLDLLDEQEKAELQKLVRKSKGRPSNLSTRERNRLSELVDKIEPAELAKHAAQTAVLGRRKS